jgi:uncharacterized membrane protein YraQ (UPF0718 family)
MQFLIILIPVVPFLCLAIFQAMKRHWKDMIITLLIGIIVLQLIGFVIQAVCNTRTNVQNISLKGEVSNLTKQLREKESNQVSEATSPKGAAPQN